MHRLPLLLSDDEPLLDEDELEQEIPLLTPDEEQQMEESSLPTDLPVLTLRNTVLFPGVVLPITVGRDASLKLVKDAYVGDRLVQWIESQLEGRFRLTINRKKTRIVNLRQPGATLDFLGFSFRYDRDLQGNGKFLLGRWDEKWSYAS